MSDNFPSSAWLPDDAPTEELTEKKYASMKNWEAHIIVSRGRLAFRFGPMPPPQAASILDQCVKENIEALLTINCGPEFDWEFCRDLRGYAKIPADALALLKDARETLASKLEDQATSANFAATDDPLIRRMDAAIAIAEEKS